MTHLALIRPDCCILATEEVGQTPLGPLEDALLHTHDKAKNTSIAAQASPDNEKFFTQGVWQRVDA